MGSVTVRYLQYLLENDFFEYNTGCEHEQEEEEAKLEDELSEIRQTKNDRSDWIASVTCINPGLNGALGTHFFGIDFESNKFEKSQTQGRVFPEFFKSYVILQNMFSQNGTMNRQSDLIKQ